MKKLLILLSMVIMSNPALAENKEIPFIKGLTDVPAMAPMTVIDGSSIEFNTVWGSIMEVSTECDCECETVREYYRSVMPNLGWKLTKSDKNEYIFERDKLSVTINMKPYYDVCRVDFSETH